MIMTTLVGNWQTKLTLLAQGLCSMLVAAIILLKGALITSLELILITTALITWLIFWIMLGVMMSLLL